MNDWTAGYVADIAYTFGYYPDLQPLRAKLPFIASGFVAPGVATACELGFGQGLSANIHAAASDVEWWGTDFIPAQAAFAQELARVSGARAHLFDQPFAEFCSRKDLPDFDFIGMHGTWSWISDENRKTIADFVRRKLKAGGIFFVSYNTMPNWAPMVPLRHLLARHADLLTASGEGIARRVEGALDFAEALMKVNPAYARAVPNVAERLQGLKGQDRHYLAHEYFNRDWQPMHFLEMAEWMGTAKLGFGCSANCLDHVDSLNLSAEQQAFLRTLPDPMFREGARDFVVNSQFRRDYWVKGARPSTALDRIEDFRKQRVVLLTPADKVVMKVTGALGEAGLNRDLYGVVLQSLADGKPVRVGDIEAAALKKSVTVAQLMQLLLVLTGKGDLAPVQDEATVAHAKQQCDRLNQHLMERARSSADVVCLASPVTGGVVRMNRFEQMSLLALRQGHSTAAQIGQAMWQLLKLQGQKIAREGRTLESDAESTAQLEQDAAAFLRDRLPLLKTLQVA